MYKIPLNHKLIKNQAVIGYGLMLTLLSLAIAACVEQFAKLMLLLG